MGTNTLLNLLIPSLGLRATAKKRKMTLLLLYLVKVSPPLLPLDISLHHNLPWKKTPQIIFPTEKTKYRILMTPFQAKKPIRKQKIFPKSGVFQRCPRQHLHPWNPTAKQTWQIWIVFFTLWWKRPHPNHLKSVTLLGLSTTEWSRRYLPWCQLWWLITTSLLGRSLKLFRDV